ncbi:MAG: response regulator, partial [Lachnospiraceae bacterium]|nr:response regulator [Lachnospiraceae bacterium]
SIAAVFNGQKILQIREPDVDTKHRFVAPDARVLVVDDNAMNLKVMGRLLLPYQIKVSTAISGEEALRKLDTMEYDCVFLDHMMPEMDGVETLHKIRKKPGAYFQSLNVIAFTANAIGGAREMFMEEGFNDFIAKPIELSGLERMLRRYIPVQKQVSIEEKDLNRRESGRQEESGMQTANTLSGERRTDLAAQPAVSGKSDEEALTDLSRAGINIGQGIAYCGDKEGFREIIGIYYKEGLKRSRQLEQFYVEQDWKNYVITVHALKSNSKGIGANELSELALQLEMAGKEDRIEYIREHHEEMMEQYDLLLRVLGDNDFIRQEEQEHETQEISEQSLKEQLMLLREKLDSFESEGLPELLEQLGSSRCGEADLSKLAEEIREKVEEFDFPGAVESLDS